MILVFGLGNPGKEYNETRHNIGFQIVDVIGCSFKISIKQYACRAVYGKYNRPSGEEIIFIKPQTYMNLSGIAVSECMDKFKIPINQVLVIHDDLDLAFGVIRLKKGGGSGGHKGIKSMIEKLGSGEFYRLKIGIGKPEQTNQVVDYVLEKFSCSERKDLPDIINRAVITTLDFIDHGFHYAANKNNES